MVEFSQFKTWLKQVSFLTEEDCNLFQPFLKTKKMATKTLFLQQDKICRELGFINSGSFRMYYLSDGKEINTHRKGVFLRKREIERSPNNLQF